MAKKHALTATVNGFHEAYWTTKRIEEAFENEDFCEPLDVVLFRNRRKIVEFQIDWEDVSVVALVGADG